jgi:hypothetical protein
VVRRDDKFDEAIDTRYEVGIRERFEDWCDEYMKRKFDQGLIPHIKKI